MRLDPRIVVPAALAVAAVAFPASASADNLLNVFCPNSNDNSIWVPMSATAAPDKDNNNDGLVCMKVYPSDQPVKDDNNPIQPSLNPNDYVDNIVP